MVGRYEISDNGWAQIEDIVAPPQTMGRPRRFMIGSASGVMTAPLKRYFLACSSNYVKMG